MESYLTLLYLTLEQEEAVKKLFLQKGWKYLKADLSSMTDTLGPSAAVRPGNVSVVATKRKAAENPQKQNGGLNSGFNTAASANTSKRRKTGEGQGMHENLTNSSEESPDIESFPELMTDHGQGAGEEADPKHCNGNNLQVVKEHSIPETTPGSSTKRKSLICDVCGKQFARSDSLGTHKRRMHGGDNKKDKGKRGTETPKKHICEKCGKGYISRCSLDEHINIKHSQNTDYKLKCTHCSLTFVRNRFLEQHVNKVHLNVQPYKCDFCDKKFYSEYYQDQHSKSGACQGGNIAKFKCFNCNQGFYSQRSLEIHMVAKHFGGAYVCVCGKTIKWEGDVPRHKSLCKTFREKNKACTTSEANAHMNKEIGGTNVLEIPFTTEI
ncbi:hypothetical protein DPMN_163117 [Dreissena polymorpha]|uniref:C2H2-type domain-containing protein n=1 Tax=Dreissena polymorpha TaxID=45954 RepID=A0A9D4EQL0_DREPO|nr:hypothetical protein DPMN_163117 [Dreissena polymorpha]